MKDYNPKRQFFLNFFFTVYLLKNHLIFFISDVIDFFLLDICCFSLTKKLYRRYILRDEYFQKMNSCVLHHAILIIQKMFDIQLWVFLLTMSKYFQL